MCKGKLKMVRLKIPTLKYFFLSLLKTICKMYWYPVNDSEKPGSYSSALSNKFRFLSSTGCWARPGRSDGMRHAWTTLARMWSSTHATGPRATSSGTTTLMWVCHWFFITEMLILRLQRAILQILFLNNLNPSPAFTLFWVVPK